MNHKVTFNKQRRIHIAVTVIVFFVAFALGIVIGYLAIKKPEEQDVEKAELQKRQDGMLTYL